MEDKKLTEILVAFQRNEITEYYVYRRLSRLAHGNNREVIKKIADEEKEHYEMLKNYTQKAVAPNRWLLFKYGLFSKMFGVTFAIKIMERGEQLAQKAYGRWQSDIPPLKVLLADEHRHEKELIKVIHEERLDYMGAIVLGLNDALVELTGALAGLSFALQDTKLVALAGSVTGIAASMSMAASSYLSKKSEGDANPTRSALYTGIAYITTVILLVLPFLVLADYRIAIVATLAIGIGIIAFFTYFNTITKETPFRRNFFEMAGLSFGVALISFLVGVVLRQVFGIEA
jgi:VIT1/CCC1 family predicted Fe2+/Mn2+ transporter